MGKPNMGKFFKDAQATIAKHSPEILLGIGIAGMFSTTILAVKATPKALRLIEHKKKEEDTDKLTVLETVKTTWKCYIPAVVTAGVSTACLIGSNSVNAKRNAVLATAYKLSETALSEYRDAVVETIGEKKEQVVKDKVAEKQLKKNPISQNEVYITKKGTTLCYDYMSGRYFESDLDTIKKAINKISGIALRDDYVSLNEFYDEIELERTGIGDEFGWNISRIGRNLIEPSFSYQPATDEQPCVVIAFEPMPKPNYSNYA